MFDMTAPDPVRRGAGDLTGLAKLGLLALRHRRELDEMAFLFATSASQYLDEHFEDEMLKSALGWESISNTLAGPSTAGTAYGLLHEAASGGTGGGVGWGFVRGGMGTVTALMADAAREAGAEIRTDAEVARVDVRGGRAVGVVMANGEEVRAMRVLSNADPNARSSALVEPSDLAGRLPRPHRGLSLRGRQHEDEPRGGGAAPRSGLRRGRRGSSLSPRPRPARRSRSWPSIRSGVGPCRDPRRPRPHGAVRARRSTTRRWPPRASTSSRSVFDPSPTAA